jgi:hypothetical protein
MKLIVGYFLAGGQLHTRYGQLGREIKKVGMELLYGELRQTIIKAFRTRERAFPIAEGSSHVVADFHVGLGIDRRSVGQAVDARAG